MFLVPEKEIAGFDVFVYDAIVVTESQGRCCLQGNASHLVYVTV